MRRALCVVACLPVLMLAACNDDDDEGGPDRATPAKAEPSVKLRFAVAGPAGRELTSRTADALSERLGALGVAGARVEPVDPAEIEVRVPRASQRDVRQAAMPGRLRFYDFEPNVLGDRGPDDPFRGSSALYEAVTLASKARPRAEPTDVPTDGENDSVGRRFYLFDSDRQPVAGPAPTRAALAPGARLSAGGRVLAVPKGVVVVEAQRAPDQPPAVSSYYVLEDDADLTSDDIEDPEVSADEVTDEPIVTFGFTDEGREAFARLTKRIARRSAETSARLPPGATEAQRGIQLQRFAIVLDDAVVSVATIDDRQNPRGIDGRTGAQINMIGDREQTERLVEVLESEPLPAELVALAQTSSR